jgi:hypothetical protein
VGFEESSELGFGEGTTEFLCAIVDLGSEVGAEFVPDVFAGGGRKRLADGLQISFE